MTGNFDSHKWFKKQYLEEADINEDWDSDVDEDVRSRVSQALTRIEDYKKNTNTASNENKFNEVEALLEDVIDALDNVFDNVDDGEDVNWMREGKTKTKKPKYKQ